MQAVCLVQTLHRDPLVSHDTGLLTWGPSQTCHPSTEEQQTRTVLCAQDSSLSLCV